MTGEFDSGLAAVLSALAPYRQDFVLVGGWVPSLYARHLQLDHAPLLTRDIDLAVPQRLPTREGTIDSLLKSAGLATKFKNLRTPPAVCYVGQIGGCDVEVEFLTVEKGNREGPKQVQPDLYAVGLHYVDLLLEHPFEVTVELADRRLRVLVVSELSY